MVPLIHSAHFVSVLALNPGHIVVKRIDGVFGTIVGGSTPGCVAFAERQPQQILIAVRYTRETDFVLPIDAAFYGCLRRIVILAPVVPAGVEVVEKGWREGVVPTHAIDFAVPLGVVVVGIK